MCTNDHLVNHWKCFGGSLVVTNHKTKKEELGVNMTKNTESKLAVGSNEYFSAESLLYFHGKNTEDYEKQ